jgi:hypothetical protein
LGPEATVESLALLSAQSQGLKDPMDVAKMAIFIEAREMRYFWGNNMSTPEDPMNAGGRQRTKSVSKDKSKQASDAIFAPLVAALAVFDNAKSILGATDEIRTPPAPKTAWPLPGPVFVGDIFARVAKQNREPVLSFKKLLFVDNDAKPDKTLYFQLVRDFVSGALPCMVQDTVVQMVALAWRRACAPARTLPRPWPRPA